MNCTDARLLVHAYADGELDLVRSLDVEKHLATCTGCTTENRTATSLRTALQGGSFHYRAPQSLRQSVRRMARGDDETIARPRAPWFWQWLAAGVTAFALVMLLLRPPGSAGGSLENEIVSNHVRSLMASHLTDVVSSDQHTVKPWFNGKLDFAPDVKDFAGQGFPLVGGRLDYLNGREVAALIYRRNQHLINVFVWPAGSKNDAETANDVSGYHLVKRTVNGLQYWLVSDLNASELGELADLIGK